MPLWLSSILLLVLTRDGLVHRFEGHHDTVSPPAGRAASSPAHPVAQTAARAIAVVDGRRVAVLAGDRLTIDGRALPGRFADVRALAGGAGLWGRVDAGVVTDRSQERRRGVARWSSRTRTSSRPTATTGSPRSTASSARSAPDFAGRCRAGRSRWPRATASSSSPPKKGPLWEVDRDSCRARNLELGDWWGTLALAWADHALYAVTVAGKLWRIDPARREKTIVAMDGWQSAIDLSVLR